MRQLVKKRLVKQKLHKFKSYNKKGKLLYYSNGEVRLHSLDGKVLVTSTNCFEYVAYTYKQLFKTINIKNKKAHILHLGVGFGYDLVWVSKFLQKQQIIDCKLSGVDSEEYNEFRPHKNKFHHRVKFYVSDVVEFIENQKPAKDEFTIICIDLPIDVGSGGTHESVHILHDLSFWKALTHRLNPDIVLVNIADGPPTINTVSQVFDINTYSQLLARTKEIYHMKMCTK